MLKRLELVGFKSFADKTTFEFGHGITAIVGPNGSGKSNVVDAVRWILGEQSAKSLRGGEMTDVIFNGSTSRRSFGMAEVAITFDNTRKLLASEAEEIQVTRRVYRSGEGEYLINGQTCRLKDIKDLFLGSGAGADAYCIIAQGKVDVLLQASTRERRTIFEEAAGISRFKAKKLETLRKLERVEQNVQRLRDIIDEVDKQLRSVKLQAAKAQRYQEYSGQLRDLRVGLGLHEYRQLSEQLQTAETALAAVRGQLTEQGSQVAVWEAEQRWLETSLAQLDDAVHQQEAQLAEARQHIKAQETTLGHEYALSAELEQEQSRLRRQVNELSRHLAQLMQSLQLAAQDYQQAQTQAQQQRQMVQALEEGLAALVARLTQLQEQLQNDKARHLEWMRQSARLQNDAVSYKAQVDNLLRELTRLRHKSEQAAETLASLDVELQDLTTAELSLQERLSQARQQLAAERDEGERLRQFRDETSESISQLRQQHSALVSRAEVLEGLERSHEGLGTGVGELLDLLEQARQRGDAACPWLSNVVGMVADFLDVRREYAPLIDLALGDWSQRFLVRDAAALAQVLIRQAPTFTGRVSFLPLQPQRSRGTAQGDTRRRNRLIEVSLLSQVRMPHSAEGSPAHAGIIARADQLVSVAHPELHDLPAQLLGRTLIVHDLRTAYAIAAHTSGFRLVTRRGELLEPDGTLTIGTHHADTGILSRKSELREIRDQILSLDHRIADAECDLVELRERVAVSASRLQQHQQEVQVLSEQAADLRSRIEMHRGRRQDLHEEVSLSQDEILRLEGDIDTLREAWQQAQQQATQAETQVHVLQQAIEQAETELRQREQQRQQRHQEWTSGKVALAKIEERVAAVQARHQQLRRDLEQRRREQAEAEQSLRACQQRWLEGQWTQLSASVQLAYLYLHKEAAERHIGGLEQQRDTQRRQRAELVEKMQSVRGQRQSQQEQFHSHELLANELRHKLTSLADRLREDYQLELEQLYQEALSAGLWEPTSSDPSSTIRDLPNLPADVAAANEEIAELRRKLQRLGSVNLDSLQELADLETRSATLGAQYEDLTAAKRALEEIIDKINTDSRRLFEETFQTIRTYFQELFRKLFGGGMADIVLEDENDILECGIEIIARPPGKELRSISLMSGGEKTMTAVALLLSIFRSKPSPFCILDEVDAALDEANIGRFADVLREFLDHSHFIIITHSKRTMAAADVIYGITMQESGISKRVSVRFEDWPDDGPSASGEAYAVA